MKLVLISALDKFQEHRDTELDKWSSKKICMSSIHISLWGKYPILESTANKPLTELWTCGIVSHAVRHSFFPNPYGDQFKPWSVKCDYPCPEFEGGYKERFIAPDC